MKLWKRWYSGPDNYGVTEVPSHQDVRLQACSATAREALVALAADADAAAARYQEVANKHREAARKIRAYVPVIPRTRDEWAAIEPNDDDETIVQAWRAYRWCAPSTTPPTKALLAAASREHERERCVAALAEWLSIDGPMRRTTGGHEDEARRILGVSDE